MRTDRPAFPVSLLDKWFMPGDGSGAAFQDEAEPTVTISEYIDGIEAEELEADLVLGGDDGPSAPMAAATSRARPSSSSYCLTCVPDGVAGVCTTCCLACHDGHESSLAGFKSCHKEAEV